MTAKVVLFLGGYDKTDAHTIIIKSAKCDTLKLGCKNRVAVRITLR